ncbi:MAG: NAD(P)/FAD-dependent oxidoreductase [Bacilli bacterium]|nr:NAD(P)/FAD-dependent oxidoreductase [Bacilli bacterium]
MRHVDLVIIGGGCAGMAAAIEAKHQGIDDILILEKNSQLGGILDQCIHNGFGLTEFKEELTGPEYASRFAKQVKELNIPYLLNTYVMEITKEKHVLFASKDEGVEEIEATAIVMATGCYERNAGAIQLAGSRCAGVITAGAAQRYLNIHGYMCGKNIVILGSGDIGLIMARRLTLEGANVICVCELMPYSNGLNRNIAQCLNDYNIPLYLSTTIKEVIGKKRLEKVILTKVDEKLRPIEGSEIELECDTLILSVGLIPYISLLENIDCPISSTKGAIVNEDMETGIPGIFSCGNCLHVHDVVDFVTDEGRSAGLGASKYIKGLSSKGDYIKVIPSDNVSYVVPQNIHKDTSDDVTLKFRVRTPIKNAVIEIVSGDKVIYRMNKIACIPSEMNLIKISNSKLANLENDICVKVNGR